MTAIGYLFWAAVSAALVYLGVTRFLQRASRKRLRGVFMQGSRGDLIGVRAVKVLDGGTVVVTLSDCAHLPSALWKEIPVRLARIEAPALNKLDGSLDDAHAARVSRDELTKILQGAQKVVFFVDDRGLGFQLICEVEADSVNVSDTMVRHGLAK